MAQGWTLAEIETKYRGLTGLKAINQRSQANCFSDLNDYYQNYFPIESELDRFKTDFTQDTSVDDAGNYLISEDYLEVKEPAYINNIPCRILRDKGKFEEIQPGDTGTANISDPGLAIGTSSTSAVKNVAFSFRIGSSSYPKAAAETELSGDSIPQSKYGAYRLEIGPDGTIEIVEAEANATGYVTAAQAVAGLEVESSDNCCMGYITVINTAAVFVPGTTSLSTGGTVTATYTDGFHSTRGIPSLALIDRRRLYLSPKPDDIFRFKAGGVARPDALTTAVAPLSKDWGIVIAYGAAVLWISESDNEELLSRMVRAKVDFLNLIRRPELKASGQKRATPRW